MIAPVARPAWYRLRATLRRDWAGYLAVVVVIGLLGGTAMASVAAARRTQSAFPRILAASNPSDLDVDTGSYTPRAVREAAKLPGVRSAESYVALLGLRALPSGFANAFDPFNEATEVVGSLDGLYFDQDRFIVTAGRRADPRRAGEIMVNEQTAHRFGLRVGQRFSENLYSQSQYSDPNADPMKVKPVDRLRLTITGIGVFTDEVVQDDVDRNYRLLATPALTRRELHCCVDYIWTGLKLARGAAGVEAVQQEIRGRTNYAIFRVTSVVEDQGDRAARPESVAAGTFGLIAALATLVLAGQAIRRRILAGRAARDVMRSLGATPPALMADACLGVLSAIAAGVVLALVVAVAVSPVAPLGQLHRFDPDSGMSFDWTVLGGGAALFVLGLAAVTAALAYGDVSARRRRLEPVGRRSAVTAAGERLGLPPAGTVGVGFAFEPAPGGYSRPARPGITGTVIALVILLASLIFGASLSSLVSHPALYGWTWDLELLSGSGYGNIPLKNAGPMLDHDPDVAAWTGAYFYTLDINHHSVPAIATIGSRVSPPILSGHAVAGPRQIVLGPETMASIGAHVNGTVHIISGKKSVPMLVAGTATMPAIGVGHGSHPSLGGGAVLPAGALPPSLLDRNTGRPGPNTILVRFRPGTDHAAAVRRIEQIGHRLDHLPASEGVQVLPVQHPAEIVNYRTMGTAPLVLAGTLAGGAVVALALSLAASTRRRSRELALLKTLGFVRGQVVAAVIWQSAVTVVIGSVIGIPLGIVAGRLLWIRFARQLYVVPQPTISLVTVVVVALGALALAGLTAIAPGWRAARMHVATVLRGE
jgi:hypothetical protein